MLESLALIRTLLPYAIAMTVGFGGAWWLQGVRLDAAKNETAEVQNKFDAYQIEQLRLKAEAEERERKRREESEREYMARYERLQKDHDAFKRCVAAGKCGRLHPLPACASSAGLGIPAAGRLDATGADAVPAGGRAAAEESGEEPPVIVDCAKTTLMLNELQADIERSWKKE